MVALHKRVELPQQPSGVSPLQAHLSRWTNGCGADECRNARRVFCRGTVPCGVLFVGEAPGESEDALGEPFVGPAGAVQDELIEAADRLCGGKLTEVGYALTNVVGCIPREGDGGKASEPLPYQVDRCRPRLEEFIRVCRPRLIVAVGRIAEDYLTPGHSASVRYDPSIEVVAVTHPGAILKSKISEGQKLMLKRRHSVTVAAAVKKVFK